MAADWRVPSNLTEPEKREQCSSGGGAGFFIQLWRGSNSDKQTQTSNNQTAQTQLKWGVYTSGWAVLLARLTSLHTDLSFVPLSENNLAVARIKLFTRTFDTVQPGF